MNKENIRVVICDDHAGVRAGLQTILSEAKDIEVVGMASDGTTAIESVAAHNPDILLLDVQMPIQRGDEVARRIARMDWGGKILAISSYADRHYIRRMREAGAAGYIMKDEAPAVLVDALRKIFSGETDWIGIAILPEDKTLPSQSTLSSRELQVLEALASGSGLQDPPESLGMSASVFKAYVEFLTKKFGVDSPAALVERTREGGILNASSEPENSKKGNQS